MHPRNRHQSRYDLKLLAKNTPELQSFIFINQYGIETIDFADAVAVRALNKALLKTYYNVQFWELPDSFLCPPIPGRADYIHAAADLFKNPKKLRVLDIGVGANCIYPLIGVKEYDWSFVGTDVNKKALKNAELIVEKNKLRSKIELRHQRDKTKIFTHMIKKDEQFDLTICNPPFHESAEEASRGSERKRKNLGLKSADLNFGGKENELWYPGGEKTFVTKMIVESAQFSGQVRYFTSLISKEKTLTSLLKVIKAVKAEAHVIEMEQGNKKSRLLYWSFK